MPGWFVSGTPAFAKSEWNFKVSAERTEQRFETETDKGEATLNTVLLSPSYSLGSWQISLTLPWQSIEGSYFFNNVYPNVAFTCNQINALTAPQKIVLVRNTSLTADDVRFCAQTGGVQSESVQESISGWNDVEVFVNYLIPYGSNWLIGSLGFGYQHDNGDVQAGLGNGIKQTFLESTWFAEAGVANLSVTMGYNFIIENNSGVARFDNGYAALDGRMHLGSVLDLGLGYHFQQSSTEQFDDYDYLMYSVYCYMGTHWTGQLYVTDYRDGAEFPDREVGLYLSWVI